MNMQIAVATSVSGSSAPSTTGAAKSAAGVGTPSQSGTGAAGKGGDFAGKLGMLLKGGVDADGKDTTATDLLMSLAAMLAGLLPNAVGSMPNQAADQQEALAQLQQLAADHPEAIQALLNRPEIGSWLDHAKQLLQAFPAAGLDNNVPTGQMNPSAAPEGAAATDETVREATGIILNLIRTVQANPDSVLLRQMTEQLQAMVLTDQGAELTAQVGTHTGSDKSGSNNGSKSGTVAKRGEIAPANANANVKAKVEASVGDKPQTVLQTAVRADVKIVPAAASLEKLASRSVLSMPIVTEPASIMKEASTDTALPMPNGQTMAASIPQQLTSLFAADAGQADIPQPMSRQTFVPDMTQFVLKSFKVLGNGGTSEATLSLSPENLGHIDVKISMNNGQVTAQFAAHTTLGKEMLESQIGQLRTSLQNQGLQVDRIEVAQSNPMQTGQFLGDRQQQQSSTPFDRRPKNRVGSLMSEDNDDDFALEIQRLTQLRNIAYGSSINVTA